MLIASRKKDNYAKSPLPLFAKKSRKLSGFSKGRLGGIF